MKADKGNCFVVMDRSGYNLKMEALLDDKTTYETVPKNPFGRVERELNSKLLALKNEGKLDERTYRRLHSSDGLLPTIRGSVKHHKEGHPLRPIVNCIGSALYNISKYHTEILSPIQNKNKNSVQNSTEFAREISNMKTDDDEIMVSFDVVSLFILLFLSKKPANTHGQNSNRTILYPYALISLLTTLFHY